MRRFGLVKESRRLDASEFRVRLRATLGLPQLPKARGHVHTANESLVPASIRSSFPTHVGFDAPFPIERPRNPVPSAS